MSDAERARARAAIERAERLALSAGELARVWTARQLYLEHQTDRLRRMLLELEAP